MRDVSVVVCCNIWCLTHVLVPRLYHAHGCGSVVIFRKSIVVKILVRNAVECGAALFVAHFDILFLGSVMGVVGLFMNVCVNWCCRSCWRIDDFYGMEPFDLGYYWEIEKLGDGTCQVWSDVVIMVSEGIQCLDFVLYPWALSGWTVCCTVM